jgi:sulfonate transport system substrate-binding protein
MKMQKTFHFFTMVLTLTLLMTVPVDISVADTDLPATMRITYVKLPLNVPSIIVKHQRLLEKEFESDGIKIERPEITSGGKQTQALAAGSLDIASVVSSTAAIAAKANGVDLKVVAVFARAPKAFNVVAIHPAIKSIPDLKGKKVAGPKGSLLNQTLFAALMAKGMRPEDIGYIHMGVPKALAALIGGSVDAALIAGPFVPKAESQGARIIANGEGLVKGLIVTAVKESFLNRHADLVKRYLSVQQKAIAYMKDHPAETLRIVAQETRLDAEDVKRMYPWYDYDPHIQPSDIQDLAATQTFLVESGMLAKPTDINSLVADISR